MPRGQLVPRHGREVHGYVHGHSVAERFDYDYSPEEVGEIAEPARLLPDRAEEVQARFNNSARDVSCPRAS